MATNTALKSKASSPIWPEFGRRIRTPSSAVDVSAFGLSARWSSHAFSTGTSPIVQVLGFDSVTLWVGDSTERIKSWREHPTLGVMVKPVRRLESIAAEILREKEIEYSISDPIVVEFGDDDGSESSWLDIRITLANTSREETREVRNQIHDAVNSEFGHLMSKLAISVVRS